MPTNPLHNLTAQTRQILQTLPLIVGNAGVNWSKDSFRRQGFLGSSLQPWQKRRKTDTGRALLIKKGAMRRANAITQLTANTVRIGNTMPYAAANNNGFHGTVTVKGHNRNRYGKTKVQSIATRRTKTITTITGNASVKSYTRKMNVPKRQFMPQSATDSPAFNKAMKDIIVNALQPLFNK